jgi:hypothetical protein
MWQSNTENPEKIPNKYWKTIVSSLKAKTPNSHDRPNTGNRVTIHLTPALKKII